MCSINHELKSEPKQVLQRHMHGYFISASLERRFPGPMRPHETDYREETEIDASHREGGGHLPNNTRSARCGALSNAATALLSKMLKLSACHNTTEYKHRNAEPLALHNSRMPREP